MTVGRGVFWKKATVEEATRLDMKMLSHDVDLESWGEVTSSWTSSLGKSSSIGITVQPPNQLRFRYVVTKRDGQKTDYDYFVHLDTTPCHFGGKRWWFICPNTTCGRRCRILYLAPGSPYFACRICHNLTYRSQQEGQNKWDKVIKFLLHYPELQRRFNRTKSPKKQASLLKKITQLANGAKPVTDEERTKS